MRIHCPNCGNAYEIDGFGVTPGMTATCEACGQTFPIPLPRPREGVGASRRVSPSPDAPSAMDPTDPLSATPKKPRLGPNMTRCPDCGEPVSKGFLVCPHCGLLSFSKSAAGWFFGGLVVSAILVGAGSAMVGDAGGICLMAGIVLNLVTWLSAIRGFIRKHGR